jgi:hypothetical protein
MVITITFPFPVMNVQCFHAEEYMCFSNPALPHTKLSQKWPVPHVQTFFLSKIYHLICSETFLMYIPFQIIESYRVTDLHSDL